MKRFATGLAVSVISLAAGGSTALAGIDDDYPPSEDVVLLLSSSVVGPGEDFSATLQGCTAGETVDFSVGDDADSAVCTNPEATVTLTAPTAEGTYTVSGEGQISGAFDTAELTVDADDDGDDGTGAPLPETGSSAGTIAQVGAALLVCGFGLVAVSRLRRRRPIGI